MRYRLYFPAPDSNGGRSMLDYFGFAAVLDAARSVRYEMVYEGDIASDLYEQGDLIDGEAVLNALWKRHNVGDKADGHRPRAGEIRSMCVGDIIVCEAGAYITERFGFAEIADDAVPEGVKRGTTQFDWGI